MSKPSWNDAPKSAKILVQDDDGTWSFGTYESATPAGNGGWDGVGRGDWIKFINGAENFDGWKDTLEYRPESLDATTPQEWDAASKAAGWGQPTEEEEEAFNEMEKKMIGKPPSKYHVCIKGVWLDVYDILHAYQRNNPADQHAIKKMLMPGQRGVKDAIQDRREAIQSLERAIELESE